METLTGGLRAATGGVLPSLEGLARTHGLGTLSWRLATVQAIAADDLAVVADALAGVKGDGIVGRSAHHLLALGGKRLRPLCVVLAARLGSARSEVVRDLATAVELVHSATLLHDDVVDLGDTRRGEPTARTVYGNAASVFAGDWLLVDALRRVRTHDVPGTLERLLETIDEMIAGESQQLEGRGKLRLERATNQRIAQGKTAALFRWAMFAGARAGGLGAAETAALEAFGDHLGLAFQLVDDALDFDATATGKTPLADLREGKATFPLIVLVEREPSARALLLPFVDGPPQPRAALEAVLAALERTGALAECRRCALQHADAAVQQLRLLPPSPVRDSLEAVAEAAVRRSA